ncbi:MAG: hypothetical protein COB66_03815 [Coxiella sp. (in: Bacteria)]|nr:MAG: hypothetical protein COB66_03815 [Coxiella sp. (in: g-proteobacteria)]
MGVHVKALLNMGALKAWIRIMAHAAHLRLPMNIAGGSDLLEAVNRSRYSPAPDDDQDTHATQDIPLKPVLILARQMQALWPQFDQSTDISMIPGDTLINVFANITLQGAFDKTPFYTADRACSDFFEQSADGAPKAKSQSTPAFQARNNIQCLYNTSTLSSTISRHAADASSTAQLRVLMGIQAALVRCITLIVTKILLPARDAERTTPLVTTGTTDSLVFNLKQVAKLRTRTSDETTLALIEEVLTLIRTDIRQITVLDTSSKLAEGDIVVMPRAYADTESQLIHGRRPSSSSTPPPPPSPSPTQDDDISARTPSPRESRADPGARFMLTVLGAWGPNPANTAKQRQIRQQRVAEAGAGGQAPTSEKQKTFPQATQGGAHSAAIFRMTRDLVKKFEAKLRRSCTK